MKNIWTHKKIHTGDGFRILPKPKPIGLAGTHGSPVGLHFTIQIILIINKFNMVNIIVAYYEKSMFTKSYKKKSMFIKNYKRKYKYK